MGSELQIPLTTVRYLWNGLLNFMQQDLRSWQHCQGRASQIYHHILSLFYKEELSDKAVPGPSGIDKANDPGTHFADGETTAHPGIKVSQFDLAKVMQGTDGEVKREVRFFESSTAVVYPPHLLRILLQF